MLHPSRATAAFLTFVTALSALRAQCPPGAPMPQDFALATTIPDSGAAHSRWRAGAEARATGSLAAAREHLLSALEFHPAAPQLLLELVLSCTDDPDLAAIWCDRLVRASCDAQGRARFDADAKKRLAAAKALEPWLKQAGERNQLRAAAIAELARFIDKQKPAAAPNGARAVQVRWAAELLLQLGEGSPSLLAQVAPGVGKVQNAFAPDHDLVFQALGRLLTTSQSADAGKPPTTGAASDPVAAEDRSIRAARILTGLRRQGSQQDLQGPPAPAIGKLADDAQKVLDDNTAADAAGKVWSIAELEAMSAAERLQFTDRHQHWRAPGLALSTSGRYRIETVCGHETLLAVAKTVELHHARLVGHYGSDPFLQRQGVVRIVPETSDLETEGAPFWWAAGFQGGDRTVVRFAWGDIPGLGRTLTHELTHRFDGVLRPFLGAWYGEGHAQWTAGHYGRMAETTCVESYLDRAAVTSTYVMGYAERGRFEQLLKGEVEDYRDNYAAGYSLYAFLRQYPPDAPRYREALGRFEQNARAGSKDPVGYFAATFADGKQGRPAKLDELHADWQRFLRGCYERGDERTHSADNEWVERYTGRGDGDDGSMVMDEPTWTWTRSRSEPFFGQEHAAAAALLLHEAGDAEGVIAAGVWSLTVDGWRPDVSAAMLAALRAGRSAEAAQAFAVTAGRHFPALAPGECVQLLAALPKCKQLLDAMTQHATALAQAKAPTAADALRAERSRLGALFGLVATEPPATPPPLPRHLGGHGFTESSLTDHDRQRVRGLWYATADGDLHVGREQPRTATGTLDRESLHRDAFVHSVGWQLPGDYVLRGRVHFTTAYVDGTIVIGHMRRDRSIRLHFASGDFAYATGRSDRRAGDGRIHFGLRGLWERDGKLPDTEVGASAPVAGEGSFDYTITVRGPRIDVAIGDKTLFSYTVHDGTPIEGQVGFAMKVGAIRVQQPTVQRLDDVAGSDRRGLDLARQPTRTVDDLLGLPVRGVPVEPNGTLVLWLPKLAEGAGLDMLDRVMPVLAKLMNSPHEHPQPWVLAVPRGLSAADRQRAANTIGTVRATPLPVIEHDVGAPFDDGDPWVLFVDGFGVLRVATATTSAAVHTRLLKWSRLFRRR
jgi:hypothetical protein